MLETKNITKTFDGYTAVKDLSLTVGDGSVFGLIGSNGAGKSTFLRMAAGILRPDSGAILADGLPVFENPEAKEKIFFITDDAWYFPNASPLDMTGFYRKYYPDFSMELFRKMLSTFGLPEKRKIRTFSKGMRKQFFVSAGLASGTKYLLCDETFDGLDPVMRQAVKSLFAKALSDRELTVVLASHNLRELEDICDHVGLMHRGGILLSKELDDMKQNLQKVQLVCGETPVGTLPEALELVSDEQRGSLHTLIVRGNAEAAEQYFRSLSPVFYERIPLSLEEIFITETEAAGYDIKNLLK